MQAATTCLSVQKNQVQIFCFNYFLFSNKQQLIISAEAGTQTEYYFNAVSVFS